MRDTTWNPPSLGTRVEPSVRTPAAPADDATLRNALGPGPTPPHLDPHHDSQPDHYLGRRRVRDDLGRDEHRMGHRASPQGDPDGDPRPDREVTSRLDVPRPAPRERVDLRCHVLGLVRVVGVTRIVSGVMAAGVVAAVGWWLLRPPPVPLEDTLPVATFTIASDPSASRPDSGGSAAGGDVGEQLVVHVAGAVRRPGVYRFRSGDRVTDAVDHAGGATRRADLDRVNLAAPLVDGQQVMVPREGEPVAAVTTGADGVPAPTGPVDLNTADAATLEALPGIGPATAAAIIAHRDEHGPFGSADDLLDVPGIGPAKLDALRDLVVP